MATIVLGCGYTALITAHVVIPGYSTAPQTFEELANRLKKHETNPDFRVCPELRCNYEAFTLKSFKDHESYVAVSAGTLAHCVQICLPPSQVWDVIVLYIQEKGHSTACTVLTQVLRRNL